MVDFDATTGERAIVQIAADDVGFGHGVVEGVVTVGASDDGVE